VPRYEVEILRRGAAADEAPVMVVAVSTRAQAEWLAARLTDDESITRIITVLGDGKEEGMAGPFSIRGR
jgi:hypothetical protein